MANAAVRTMKTSDVTVYYVVGTPRSAARSAPEDLAKFFEKAHAVAHMAQYRAWHNVHIEPRAETIDEQHEAHKPLFR